LARLTGGNVTPPAAEERVTPLAAAEERVSLYIAPFANPVSRLKRVSFTTAILSMAIPPSVYFMGSSVPLSGQLAITGVSLLASLSSTAALHYLFSPYILSLTHVVPLGKPPEMNGASVLEAETLTLWGSAITSTFTVDDALPTRCPSMKPVYTT
jgi:hypothetical protein